MRPEPQFAPHGAAMVNQIHRIVKSRGIEMPRVQGSINRISSGTWRVDQMTKAGVAIPAEIFTNTNGKWTWKVAAP